MCQSPIRLKNGVYVACGKCPMCWDNYINDWCGRCIAEQKAASNTLSLTLTYRGTGQNAAILDYKDIQLMFANLRHKYSVRYLVAGEYGTEKGRAHWHAILFFRGDYPEVRQEARVEWEYWPHGHTYFQTPDYSGFRYVVKYALKSHRDQKGNETKLSMSKKPPLGYFYFMELADRMAKGGFYMADPAYSFADVKIRSKKRVGYVPPRVFWLSGRMRELFFAEYLRKWAIYQPKKNPDTPYITEHYLDKIVRREIENDLRNVEAEIKEKTDNRIAEFIKKPRPVVEGVREIGTLVFPPPQSFLAVLYSDGSLELDTGESELWRMTLGSDGKNGIVAQMRPTILPLSVAQDLQSWGETRLRLYQASVRPISGLEVSKLPQARAGSGGPLGA